jgi:hypothetical protein
MSSPTMTMTFGFLSAAVTAAVVRSMANSAGRERTMRLQERSKEG